MNAQQIAERLTAIHSALVEKTGEQPWTEPSLEIHSSGKCSIDLYGALRGGSLNLIKSVKADSIEEILDATDAFIASLPSPEEASIRRYMAQVAKTVECGREENIPDEYVVPFREVLTAMTENLLPAPKAEDA